MEYQLAGALLVVTDEGPRVEAELGVGQLAVILCPGGQRFQATAEVIGKIPHQSAREWQFHGIGRFGESQLPQGLAKAVDKVVGRFVGSRRQFCQWPGAE